MAGAARGGAVASPPVAAVDQAGLESIRRGGRRALARALSAIEGDFRTVAGVLDAALAARRALTIGLTGPPGAGKSSLLGALVRRWRAAGDTVGIIAVDPSSRRSGGALLGDRLRLHVDGDDPGLFVRSMAARRALGGVADLTLPSLVLMAAIHDRVVIETVGVGQSETDIRDLVDAVVLCVPPAGGDMIQFMKAGIVEIPDLIAVTKADMGAIADRALSDIRAAMEIGSTARRAVAVSAQTGANLAVFDDPAGLVGADGPRDLPGMARAWAIRQFDLAQPRPPPAAAGPRVFGDLVRWLDGAPG